MPFGSDGLPARVLELLEQAVIVADAAGIVTFMNPFAERLYGWGPGEAIGRDVLEVNVAEQDREQALQVMETLRAGKSWSGKFPVQRRDGTRFTAWVTDTPVFDREGRLRAIIGLSRDVTEEERAAEKIRMDEIRFRAIADEAPVAIFEIDADGRHVYLNGVGREMLGATPGDAPGARWEQAVHPEDRKRIEREWRGTDATGEVFVAECRLRGPDGLYILAQVRATALRGPDRKVTGHVGSVIDISRNESLRTQLALATRLASVGALVAEAAEKVSPLIPGAIPGRASALEGARTARNRLKDGAPLDRAAELEAFDEVIEALEAAGEAGRRITAIVKEMTQVGKAVPGRIRVRLYDVVSQALHWLPEEVARSAEVEVEKRIDPDVAVSAGQIEQVVVNLVTNAMRATPRKDGSKVTVRIDAGRPGMVRLEVVDRGPGVDPDARDKGLGLVVSHVIVAAHGGTLSVSTEKGTGSTVRLELPVAGPTVH
jgi:PAS domain S-box-containing protein